ncbi:Dynamin-related protein 4C [Nymphaea thermarum]|nr:Dynamin-related protein 4C [Nymphaea thermarum]
MGDFSAAQLVAMLIHRLCTRNSSQIGNAREREQFSLEAAMPETPLDSTVLQADQPSSLEAATTETPLDSTVLQADQHSSLEAAMPETPLDLSFNKQIRPLLDTIDELRRLNIQNIGIQIPSIVVIGDQSSGKSSVLESLARVKLPKGMKMCTRMPLVLQMKDHPSPNLEMELVFGKERWPVSEDSVEEEVKKISIQNAGNGISNKEINLIIRRKDMQNLTLIDLPGITRVPLYGQPQDIKEQICELINKYIKQEDSIILNVLPASVDFSTCESIQMSRKVDESGKRTLAVVTKVDLRPEELDLEMTIRENHVKIGLGYVCVRNRLAEETHEVARKKEMHLFGSPPLSTIDRSMVGIPMLERRLLQIQERQIRECLPRIASEIQDKLYDSTIDSNKLPLLQEKKAKSIFDDLLKEMINSLEMLLVRSEFQEYPHEKDLHGTTCVQKEINSTKAAAADASQDQASQSQAAAAAALQKEFEQLKETQGPWLPCPLPRNAFITLLHERVKDVAKSPEKFMEDVWKHVQKVVEQVIDDKFKSYEVAKNKVKKAANNVLMKKKDLLSQQMSKIVEMEQHTDYTCNPHYLNKQEELKKMQELKDRLQNALEVKNGPIDKEMLDQAFELHIKLASYWRIVVMGMVDVSTMHVLMSIKQLIYRELKSGIEEEVLVKDKQDLENMMSEPTEMAEKREKLQERIGRLKRAKELVASVQLLPGPST